MDVLQSICNELSVESILEAVHRIAVARLRVANMAIYLIDTLNEPDVLECKV